MKTSHLLSLALLGCSLPACAEGVQAASPHSFSSSLTVTSDYMFRGMTQTWGNGAVQGSLDYVHASGLYGGLWASNVSPKIYAGGYVEADITGGFRGAFTEDFGYSAEVKHIVYPGANYKHVSYADLPSQRYDNTEATLGLSYRWVSLKYGYMLNDLLGFNEKTGYTRGTRGSTYIDLSVEIPLPQEFSLGLHAGRQDIKAELVTPTAGGSTNPDFTDYRVSLSKRFADDWLAMLAWTRNQNTRFFNSTPSNKDLGDLYDMGKTRVSLSLTKVF